MKFDKFLKIIFEVILSMAMMCSQFSSSLVYISALENAKDNLSEECTCNTDTEIHAEECPSYVVENEVLEICEECSGENGEHLEDCSLKLPLQIENAGDVDQSEEQEEVPEQMEPQEEQIEPEEQEEVLDQADELEEQDDLALLESQIELIEDVDDAALLSVNLVTFDIAKGDVVFTDSAYSGYDGEGSLLTGEHLETNVYKVTQSNSKTNYTIAVGTESTAVTKSFEIHLSGVNIDAPKTTSNHKAAVYVNTNENNVYIVLDNNTTNTLVSYGKIFTRNASNKISGLIDEQNRFGHAAIEKEIETQGTLIITCEEGLIAYRNDNHAGHDCDLADQCGSLSATSEGEAGLLNNATRTSAAAAIGSKAEVSQTSHVEDKLSDASAMGTLHNLVIAGGKIDATGSKGNYNTEKETNKKIYLGGSPAIGVGAGFQQYTIGYKMNNLCITGGHINAKAGDGSSAGIGGGYHAGEVTVNIYGGTIVATEQLTDAGYKRRAPGIGGGGGGATSNATAGATVNIYGGTITASSEYGAAIGAGAGGTSGSGKDATVNIHGGTIVANTYKGAGDGAGAAIGTGGSLSTGKGGKAIINITGGTIVANSELGADIGGGGTNSTSTSGAGGEAVITISGGTITALSGGIGGGNANAGKGGKATLTINNGTINASKISGGSSKKATGGDAIVTINGGSLTSESIGGGSGGTGGNGGAAEVTITDGTILTGSIGGGSTKNPSGKIGYAKADISGGDISGQFLMASGGTKPCSFTMTGGLLHNVDTTKNDVFAYVNPNGAAVYMDDPNGTAVLSGGTIEDCHAENGGAVYMTAGTFTISGDSTINNCSAKNTLSSSGGAIYLGGGTLNVNGGTITGNEAVLGGSIYLYDGIMNVTSGVITDSDAVEGGAVYLGGGTLNVNGGTISNNRADNGGGIYLNHGTMTVSDGYIESNTAYNNGAGAFVDGGDVVLTGGTVASNTATNNGGGIVVNNGNYTMVGGSVINNTAQNGSGGGVYVTTDTADVNVNIYSGSISGNQASISGGAMSVIGPNEGELEINVQFGVNERHFDSTGAKIDCDHDITSHVIGLVTSCPEVKNNITGINGGAVYITGNNKTVLKMFCLQEGENKVINDTLSYFMKVEGGKVLLNTLQPDGEGNLDPDSEDASFGNIHIENTIYTTGGTVDIYGEMTNPHTNTIITVDMTKEGDAFNDHRDEDIYYKLHYYENFRDPVTNIVTGQYKAYNIPKDSTITILGNIYEHPGYSIRGWNTEPDASGKWYPVGSEHVMDGVNLGSFIIYAIWDANGYKVTFDSNVPANTFIEGSMPDYQLHTYDVSQNLILNGWSYPGYHFVGWNTEKDGSGTSYDDGALVSNLTDKDQITLYAQWEKCDHSVTLYEYTYELTDDGKTIEATCECQGYTETATLIAENGIYNRNKQPAVVRYSPNADGIENLVLKNLEISYKTVSGGAEIPCADDPVNAGDYIATISVESLTANATYTINKAPQDISVQTMVDNVEIGGKTQLRVHEIAESALKGVDPTYDSTRQYQLVYYNGAVRVESEWFNNIGTVVQDKNGNDIRIGYVFDLNVDLTNYYVYVRYSEGTNYLASDAVAAIKPYFFNNVTVYPHFGEGVLPTINLASGGSGSTDNGISLSVALENNAYYFPNTYEVTYEATVGDTVTTDPVLTKLTFDPSNPVMSYTLTNIPAGSVVHIYIPAANKHMTMSPTVTENQVFGSVTANSAKISRDSAFTSYFEVSDYKNDEYEPLVLSFEPAIPQGTTIIMQSKQSDHTAYYWYEALTNTTSISLTEFTRMGSAEKYCQTVDEKVYLPEEGNLKLQFVVDFSKANSLMVADSKLKVQLSATARQRTNSDETDVGAKSTSNKVDVNLSHESQFNMSFNADAAITRQIYLDYHASEAVQSKWNHRNMAVVLKPVDAIPSDAYMIFSYGQYTMISHANAEGVFIVPLSQIADKEVSVTLVSNAFPTDSTEYRFAAEWRISNSNSSGSVMNGVTVASNSDDLVFKTKTINMPSIKVTSEKQLYNSAESSMNINVYLKHVDSTHSARVVLMRKANNGVYTNTGWSTDLTLTNQEVQQIENLPINLAGQEPGSFALHVSVSKDVDKVVETYFYFILEDE